MQWTLIRLSTLLLAGAIIGFSLGDEAPGDGSALAQIPTTVPTAPLSTPNSAEPDFGFLSGVGATAVNDDVAIRSGPGTNYPGIMSLPQGLTADVVGYNGFDPERPCRDFYNDLDMWIEVQWANRRGWVARCTVDVVGELFRLPITAPPPPPTPTPLDPRARG